MPPPIDDPVLGRLEWGPDDWPVLSGTYPLACGRRVELGITVYDGEGIDEVLPVARVALQRFRDSERRYRLWSATQVSENGRNGPLHLPVEDIANALHVSCLEVYGTGVMRAYWDHGGTLSLDGRLVTVITCTGECVRVIP